MGIAQLTHAVGESILCREGATQLFPNDFEEDLFNIK